MSSSGLIYAVIVGAWAAYLVPMWLRRQDELNEARPTERFSTAIRLLSGRAGMERRYARDLRARSAQEGEPDAVDPDAVTDSVDVRAFAVPPTRRQEGLDAEPLDAPPAHSPHRPTGRPRTPARTGTPPSPAPGRAGPQRSRRSRTTRSCRAPWAVAVPGSAEPACASSSAVCSRSTSVATRSRSTSARTFSRSRLAAISSGR